MGKKGEGRGSAQIPPLWEKKTNATANPMRKGKPLPMRSQEKKKLPAQKPYYDFRKKKGKKSPSDLNAREKTELLARITIQTPIFHLRHTQKREGSKKRILLPCTPRERGENNKKRSRK